MNTHCSPTPHTGRGTRRTPDQPQRLLCRPAGPHWIAPTAGLLAAALLLTASLPAAVVASYDFEDGVAVYNFTTWDNDHNPNVTGPDAWTAVVSNGGNAQYGSNPAGSPRPPGESSTDCFAFGYGTGDYRKRFNATYVAGTNYGVSLWAYQGTTDPGGAITLELGRGTANNFVSLASTVIDTAGRPTWTRYSVTNLLTATSAIHSSNIVVRISGFTGDVWLDLLEIFTAGSGGASSDVTIDFSITNSVGPKLNKLFGTYASEKTIYAEKIYETSRTVGALNLPFNRQQLWLKEKPANPNPSDSWTLAKSGSTWTFAEQWNNQYLPNQVSVTHIGGDVLVTLGVPSGGDFLSRLMGSNPSARNSALNELRQCFTDIVVKLRGPTYVGPTKPLYVELFGEPDLFNFFGPNNTFDEFWEVFTYAYAGVRAAGGANVRVGGSGHAFPEWPHLSSFINRLRQNQASIQLDFLSFHHYMQWADSTVLNSPGANPQSLQTRLNIVHNLLNTQGPAIKPEVMVTEISWPNGDYNIAANPSHPDGAANSMTNYRHAARTLELFDIMLNATGSTRYYFAQGVGDSWISQIFTFFPIVVYDRSLFGSEESAVWRYKSAYYSFWFYNLMSANRGRITFANTDVNGFASVDGGGRHRVALWNRTSGSRTFTLGFEGLGPDLSQYTCTVHLVNNSTYQNTNQYPPVTQTVTLDNLRSLTLTREATAFLDIAGPAATHPPASGSWAADADGDWGDAGKWTGNVVALGSNNTATFAHNITADRTVNNDTARAIGHLVFGDADPGSAGGWTIGGTQALTLQVSNGTPAITVNALGAGKLASIDTPLAGTQGLARSGVGTLALNAANTFSGPVTVSGGALRLGHANAVQNSTGVTVTNHARVQPTVSGATYANVPLTLSGHGDLGNNHFGAWYVNDNNGNFTWPGAITLAGDATIGSFGTANTNTFSGVIGGAGGLRFWGGGAHNSHTHQFVLGAANTYSGPTTLEATWAANCEVKLTTGNNRLPVGTVLTLNASSGWNGLYSKLILNGRNQTLGGLVSGDGGGTHRIVNGSATAVTLTLNNSADHLYAGFLGGPGANENNFNLTKRGPGTLTLAGVNTYSGATTVSNGMLRVNGSLGGGAVTVWGGTLSGVGTIGGVVTVQAGGTLAPGESIGTLTVNNTLTLAAGSATVVEMNAQTPASDRVVGLTTISYGGTLVVTHVAGTLAAGQTYPLFSAASASGNFSDISPATPGPGLAWSFNPTNGALSVVAAPPPQLLLTVTGTNTLVASWSGSGFRLQAQTNTLSAGLTSNWFDYPAGTSSPVVVPFQPDNASVFLRLISP